MAELDLGALSYTMKLKKDGSWKSGFSEAGKDIDNHKDKVKEADNANEAFESSLKNFASSLQITGTNFDNLDKKLKLWMLDNKENTSDIDKNNKAIDTNKAKLAELSTQLEKGNSLLKQVKTSFGENSEQYKKAENSILDLQIAYKKVEDETKRMEDSNEELKKSLNPSFFDNLKDKITSAMSGIGQSIKNGIGFSIGRDLWDKFKEGSTSVLTFGSDAQKAMNQLQASTGMSTESLNSMKQTMTDIYNDNFGESFDDIGNALGVIQQNWRGNSNEIKGLTENALLLRDTFGYEVNESFRSANMLVQQFGLSGKDAYNLIAQGAQSGLDKNGDLLDSVNEYSVQFKGLGFNAQDMFNMLSNGAKSGTFSVDKLGDAVKEFGIRAKDGSSTTQDAFQQLELNVQATEEKFAKGGDTAKQAFQQVNEKLLGLKDPLKQNQIGVELWGTMWEDLGKSGISSLTNLNGSIATSKNALDDMNKVKYNDLGSAFQGIKRNLETGILLPISNEVLPKLSDFSNWFTAHMPQIKQDVSNAMAVILPIIEKAFKLLGDGLSFVQQHSEGVKASLIVFMSMFGSFTIVNGAVNTINNFSKALTNGKTAIDNMRKAGEFLGDGFSKLGGFAKNTASTIADFSSKVGKIAWNGAVNGAKTLGNGLKTIATSALEGAKALGTLIVNLAKSAASFAVSAARATAHAVALGIHKIAVLASSAAEKILAAAQAALNFVMSLNPITLIIIAIAGLVTALTVLYLKNETFRNFINAMWAEIKIIVGGAISAVVGFFQGLGSSIVSIGSSIGSFLSGLWNGIASFAIGAWNGLRSGVIGIVSGLVSGAINIFNGIVNFFWNLPGTLYNAGVSAFSALRNGISAVIGGIYGVVAGGFNSAISFITSLPGRAYSWGADFIQGIVRGIRSAIGSVVDAVSGVADRIRSFLHFSVPDEGPLTDYESWMPDFMQGLTQGIEKNKHLVTNAIKNLATDVNVGMKLNPAVVGVGDSDASINGSSTSQGNTTINFNGSYSFADKKDMDYFMNQAALLVQRRK